MDTLNTPRLAVIGGRLEDDNAAIYAQMHRLSGGRILVFATASSEPEEVGRETVEVFRAHGFDVGLSAVHGPEAAKAAADPAQAALDPWCRAYDHPNLFVVDASFFPSSAALNPALTVAAQGLRVGQYVRTHLHTF